MNPIKYILAPVGSAGDVLPLVWLGKLLEAQGHEVVMTAHERVRDMPERAGLRTIAYGELAEQEAIVRNPDIWHPRKAFQVVVNFAAKWAGETYHVIAPEIEAGRTVIVAGALALGARILSERMGIPLLTVHLQPSVFMSIDESPVMMAGGEWLPRAPRFVRRAFFGMANWQIDRLMSGPLEQVRVQAGLPAGRLKGIMRTYWHSPDGVLCMFPEWFAGKAPDWPAQAVLTRFPLYDEEEDRPFSAELSAFLEQGRTPEDRPIVITPGSANAHAQRYFVEAAKACAAVNRRAILVTAFPEQVPPELVQPRAGKPAVLTCDYVPFGALFPHAAAVIHHGGVGTTAQCLAAGVPQLIMPLAHDQPDNAARIKRMGVGDYVYPKRFRAPAVAAMLEALVKSTAVRHACAAYQRKCREQMSAVQTAELVGSLSERALRIRQINGVGILV